MRVQNFIIPVLLLAGLLLTGCYSTEVSKSSLVNQDAIYMDYSVYFDAESKNADARAVFRFESWKGNTLDLDAPSSIQVNGKAMNGDKEFLVGYVYRANRVQNENNEYTFTFTDTEGKVYKNKAVLNPIEIKSDLKKINKNESNTIAWEGAVLNQDETVELSIVCNDTISSVFSTQMRGSNSLNLSKEDLAMFPIGLANLKLTRYLSKELDEATSVEGVISGNYVSKIRSIEIVD